MNKKIVVLGGGRGLSALINGLKMFPLDITAVVAVSDSGSSTGRLREEFNTPAVGDIREVLITMAEDEDAVRDFMGYRFNTTSDLDGHTLGNLVLTAMTKLKGNLSDAIEELGSIFRIKGKILPFTEDEVTLVATMSDGSIYEGEHHITEAKKTIVDIKDKEENVRVTPSVLKVIEEADLIILGIGSLYTSLIPNLLSNDMRDAILKSKAKKMYICNAMTQSGETDNFKVSDCVNILNKYMEGDFLDVVIASNSEVPQDIIDKYKTRESKSTILLDKMVLDEEVLNKMKFELIQDDLLSITKEGFIQHDSTKVAFLVFSYLIKK